MLQLSVEGGDLGVVAVVAGEELGESLEGQDLGEGRGRDEEVGEDGGFRRRWHDQGYRRISNTLIKQDLYQSVD